jgi:CheY-like chemotaxis protein
MSHPPARPPIGPGSNRGDGPPASVPPAPADRSLRVLLAEDNLINQEVANRMLARLGCRVDVVGDGRQAVEAARRDHYDLIMMDVQMPDLDGLEATRRIRAEVAAADQPYIIALTASASRKDRDACLAAGMDAYLSKPIHLAELADAVNRVPTEHPAGPAARPGSRPPR